MGNISDALKRAIEERGGGDLPVSENTHGTAGSDALGTPERNAHNEDPVRTLIPHTTHMMRPDRDSAWPHEFPAITPEKEEEKLDLHLMDAIRRRWVTVLLLFIVQVGGIVPYVWLRIKPTYTATAQIEVAPAQSKILYEDENSRTPRFFVSYLNTQALRIRSNQVLTAALSNPDLQGASLLESENPEAVLRAALEVTIPPGTNILKISVTQPNPEEAIRFDNAVVAAYIARVDEWELAEERKKLSILEGEQKQLRSKLDQQRAEIRKLSEAYGTASDATFDVLRQAIVEASMETKRDLERAELDVLQLREKLERLNSGDVSAMPSEGDATYFEQKIEKDPVVRSLREELQKVSTKLVRLRSTLTEEHEEVITARETQKRLLSELSDERARAVKDVEREIQSKKKILLQGTRERIEQELAAAESKREGLANKIQTQEAEGLALGRHGVEIQALREQADMTDQDYTRVNERIKQLEMERQRPARVTVMSPAEFLAGAVHDKRPKLTFLAIFAAFCMSAFVGLVKDRLDPHLHAPREVESGTGLRVLGAVPCLSELKSGYVTQAEFAESYRLVRTCLSSTSPDGVAPKSILITSAQAGEGKTSLAISLAASFAEGGDRKVLLIDGDTQAPSIGKFFELTSRNDLPAVLEGKCSLTEASIQCRLRGVDVLVTGVNDPIGGRTLSNHSAIRVLREASQLYDHVVIDTPPALGAADAMIWAHAAEGTVFSSLAGQSDLTAMKLACTRLKSAGATLLGAVVGNVSRNDVPHSFSLSGTEGDRPEGRKRWKSGKERGAPVVPLPPSPLS